jgi:hypothetical protein
MAGLFDGGRDGTLVSGAGAGLAARTDRTVFGDVLAKHICLLVVNRQCLIGTELTKFRFGKEAAFPATFHAT